MIYREVFIFGFLLLYLQKSQQQNMGNNGLQIITIGKPILVKKQPLQPRIVTPKQILNFHQQPPIATTLIQLQPNSLPVNKFNNILSNSLVTPKSLPISNIPITMFTSNSQNVNPSIIAANPQKIIITSNTPKFLTQPLSLATPTCQDASFTQLEPSTSISIPSQMQSLSNIPITMFRSNSQNLNPSIITASAVPNPQKIIITSNTPEFLTQPLSLATSTCQDASFTQLEPGTSISTPSQTQSSVSLSDVSEKISLLKSSLLLLPILLSLLKEKVSEATSRTELNCDFDSNAKTESNCESKDDNYPYDLSNIIMKNKMQYKLDSLTDMNNNNLDYPDSAKDCSD